MYYEKSKSLIENDRNKMEIICLDTLVPEDHILRKIDQAIDLSFIHDMTRELYSETAGRKCIDTVILFKIVLLNFICGNNSIRKTCEEAKVNLAYKWYLGIGLSEPVPNYSTFSQNYIRKFSNTNIFEEIFTRVLNKIMEKKLIDTDIIFVDGTHIKANANKHKSTKKQVKIITDKYHKDLEKEINEFRELNGRDKYPSDDDDNGDGNITIDEETGEVIEKENKNTQEITVSTTDEECGMFVKGEHERQFAYVDQVACDKHGWILGYEVNPGNVHDSKAFLPFFENKLMKYKPFVCCCDAGYANALIAHYVQERNCKLLVPYTAPKGQRTEFGKKEFDYYFEIDQYMCPNRKMLVPWNISKSGNIEYKIHKNECGNCPYKEKCIKQYAFKTITRHIYDDCMLLARNYRLSSEGKEIYKLRKETIERVFAEGKEYHGLRYTRFKGLKKNSNIRALLYACLNIKKMALLETRVGKQIEKEGLNQPFLQIILSIKKLWHFLHHNFFLYANKIYFVNVLRIDFNNPYFFFFNRKKKTKAII